jgi:hypothetical protein
LHPSHNRFTDERVFIPRTCSIWRTLDPRLATLPCAAPRSLCRPFVRDFVSCEEYCREKKKPLVVVVVVVGRDADGRRWRRARVEGPRTERRESIVAAWRGSVGAAGGGMKVLFCLDSVGR